MALVIAIVLLGYWKAFAGGDFFVHEDMFAISNYSYGNVAGAGWRSDKGLGVSFFFGDPGVWHVWSLFTLWEEIVLSRELAYTLSVIGLGIVAALVQYAFIRRVAPGLGALPSALIAPVVVFCSDQAGYHYLRLSIALVIAIPLMLLLLHDYYRQPKALHFFLAGLLFWFVSFMGNLWNLTQLLTLGSVFTIAYWIYHKAAWKPLLGNFVKLYLLTGLLFLLLGAWIIYPMMLEQTLVGYLREKVHDLSYISVLPNLQGSIRYLIGLLSVELLPLNHELTSMQKPFVYTWNVSVVFPLVFLFFLFRRADSFWEFALKLLLVVFTVHWGLVLTNVVPGYGAVFSYLSAKSSKLFTMYDFLFPLQVLLIALYVAKMGKRVPLIEPRWGRRLQRAVALLLCGVFGTLLLAAVFASLSPDVLPATARDLIDAYAPQQVGHYPRDYIAELLSHDIDRFQALVGWHTVLFYITSLALIAPFLRDVWLAAASRLPKLPIALLLIANSLLLSWTIYPLNDRQPVWKQEALAAYRFEPTDRFYFVSESRANSGVGDKNLRLKWDSGGAIVRRERQIGLLEPPGLNLSGLKSFATADEGKFIYRAFNGDGVERIRHLRLYYGGPVHVSPLLDMAAVKYYYSDRPLLDPPAQLSLFASTKHLYIYRNNAAWPYFYLAKDMVAVRGDEIPLEVRRGAAYVNESAFQALRPGAGDSAIHLTSFSGGRMAFDFDGRQEEFLVVADAWHPFWRARANNQELPVIRANGLFKGIRLPPGKYEVALYFDTSAYRPGIYVSAAAWVALCIALFMTLKRRVAVYGNAKQKS